MKYSFYPGCSYHSSAGYQESVAAVCGVLGIELQTITDWNCCGATVFMGVDKIKAATLSARIFALSQREGFDAVITGCNACYTTLKKNARLLMADADLTQRVTRNLANEGLVLKKELHVRHLLDLFIEDVAAVRYQARCNSHLNPIQVAGYYGCQYTRPWLTGPRAENPDLLEGLIDQWGFTALEHSAKTMCCGASLAIPHAPEALTLASRIVQGVTQAGADLVVTICPLCQFNLDNLQHQLPGKHVPILFFTQLLGMALGLAPSQLGLDKLLTPLRTPLYNRITSGESEGLSRTL